MGWQRAELQPLLPPQKVPDHLGLIYKNADFKSSFGLRVTKVRFVSAYPELKPEAVNKPNLVLANVQYVL